MSHENLKIIHLIPHDGLGGVEAAARSSVENAKKNNTMEFCLMLLAGDAYLLQPSTHRNNRVIKSRFKSENNPFSHVFALAKLIKEKPDILVCSLWRTIPLGIIYKLLSPKLKFVCFLHSARNAHFVDKIITFFGIYFADRIWADSDITLSSRVNAKLRQKKNSRIISFVLENISVSVLPKNSPVFVFWGRLHYIKGVDRALHLFKRILRSRPDAVFYIYGPDYGEESKLRNLAGELNISSNIKFMGPTRFSEIKLISTKFSYYLQLSRDEGMAISVVEAMQLGLVPIVTPVGEIATYCKDGVNALVVKDLEEVVSQINAIFDDNSKYLLLQKNSVDYWKDKPLYRDDIIAAIAEICMN